MIRENFDNLVNALFNESRRFYQDRLISFVLFGSVGRGVPNNESDVDVLIVANPLPDGRIKRIKEFMNVEKKLDNYFKELRENGIYTFISPVIKTPAELEYGSPLMLDMVYDSKILYDREDFFKKRLERLKLRLQQLGAKRIYAKGGWFWVLKPDIKPGEIFEL